MLKIRQFLLWTLLLLVSCSATDSSGQFIQPKTGSDVAGSLLLSVEAQDPDGLTRVHISFNNSRQVLELCQSAQQCQGSSFRTTLSNVDPTAYAASPGTLNLKLWVTDGGGNLSNVAEVSVNWQPLKVDNLQVQRSASGEQIDVSWNPNPAILRYSLYLASVTGVNRQTYRELPDGQARLAVSGPAEIFTGLDPTKHYYLLMTGISGSGESALTAEIAIAPPLQQPNQSPIAVDDDYSASVNQTLQVSAALGVLANDSDPDGDPLTVDTTPLTPPVSGTLTLGSDGSFSYTANPNFVGSDSFAYQITDGKGGVAQAEVVIQVNNLIANITGESLNISGEFLYIGQGENPLGSGTGTGLYRIGDCIQLVDTRCTMQGRYEEAAQSGNVPGQQGKFAFMMIYPGVADSPVLARSVAPNSNNLQFTSTGQARFELSLFPDSGGKFSGLYPATPFLDSLNFGAFILPGAICTGLAVNQSCTIGQVGQVAGARMTAALDRLTFTVPGSALNNQGPFPPVASNDVYPANANQALNIAAPGVLGNDLEGNNVLQGNQLEIRHSLNPALGSLVGLAVNEYQQALYAYPSFGSAIPLINRLGNNLGSLTMQGEGANDVDLDIAQQAFKLQATQVPQGSLLIFNGETGPTEIYAVDPANGTLLSQLNTAFGDSHVVGGAYNPVTDTIWLLQDNVPAGIQGDRIAQINPATGEVLSSFNLVNNQHSFSVSFGDLHINPHNGHILVVSSIQSNMAEFDLQGNLLRLLPLPPGVTAISGLAVNADGSRLWMASTNGAIFEMGFANQGKLPTLKATLLNGPGNGTVILQPDGRFSYTPNANFTGQDSFSYQLTGAFGGTSQATVTINVQ